MKHFYPYEWSPPGCSHPYGTRGHSTIWWVVKTMCLRSHQISMQTNTDQRFCTNMFNSTLYHQNTTWVNIVNKNGGSSLRIEFQTLAESLLRCTEVALAAHCGPYCDTLFILPLSPVCIYNVGWTDCRINLLLTETSETIQLMQTMYLWGSHHI